MRREDLFGQGGTRTQHADNDYRTRRWIRRASLQPEPRLVVGTDDQIDGPRQQGSVVSGPTQLGQLVRTLVVEEGLFEIFEVIEIFADGIA